MKVRQNINTFFLKYVFLASFKNLLSLFICFCKYVVKL